MGIERCDVVIDVPPIPHETPEFNASKEFMPIVEENATQDPPRFKKGG